MGASRIADTTIAANDVSQAKFIVETGELHLERHAQGVLLLHRAVKV